MNAKLRNMVESQVFQNFIIAIILVNAVVLGMETSKPMMESYGSILLFLDGVILGIFTIELILKLFVYHISFFKQPWNVFDLLIVAIAYVPMSGPFAALRTLRILRVLRLLSTVPALRRVIEGLLRSIPGILSVTIVLMIFYYVFAVIGTHLYGNTFPEWFGSMGKTMFTLFQVMTLESWSMGIVRPVMDAFPNAWIFFVTYILTTTFTMLNLFIAIIVNSMQTASADSAEESRLIIKQALSSEIKEMENRILAQLQRK